MDNPPRPVPVALGYVQTRKSIGTKVKTAQSKKSASLSVVLESGSNAANGYNASSRAGVSGTRVAGQANRVAVPWSVYSVSPYVIILTVR